MFTNKSKNPAYQSWHSMIRRCLWKDHKDYGRYGAMGIGVVPRWEKFENFLADMGPRPPGTTLERRDNKLGYFPENCKWATPTEQNFNRKPMAESSTGVVGVCRVNNGKAFRAYGKLHGVTTELYRGPDLDAAIKARKAWETANVKRTP